MSFKFYLFAFICTTTSATNYKEEMRTFVREISQYSKDIAGSSFLVIPQNGQELLTINGESDGPPDMRYIGAIDGVGREDLFYGYERDNKATPNQERKYMIEFLDLAFRHRVRPLVTDYCSSRSKQRDSYRKNNERGYISFAANRRDLDRVPTYPTYPWNHNTHDITSLHQAKNFLYLLDGERFDTKTDYLNKLRSTKHDILIIDLFFNDHQLTESEMTSLKTKAGSGSRRLVVCYMSIGEAEDYRYYWKSSWGYRNTKPSWLAGENPDWPGNYKVRYWMREWKNLIYGNENSYLKKILNSGCDGVYLDIIDAFEYFEN